jgi:molecular chaperone DnaJ
MPRNYYEVLGVEANADPEAIKRAYRRRSRELHPDVNAEPGSDSRFSELSEAYTVLSREESRRLYDRFGWRGPGLGFDKRRGRVYAASRHTLAEDLEHLFAACAGRKPDGEPTKVVGQVEVDAYEARLGATKSVTLDEAVPCEVCDGAGGEVIPCRECGGKGRQRRVTNTSAGRLLQLDACETCGGGGQVPLRECEACGGRGVVEGAEIRVPVPPGVQELDRVRVGPDEVAIVRIVRARERLAVRLLAIAALVLALGFLLFLLSL